MALRRVLLKSAMGQIWFRWKRLICRASRNWRCSSVETIEAVELFGGGVELRHESFLHRHLCPCL